MEVKLFVTPRAGREHVELGATVPLPFDHLMRLTLPRLVTRSLAGFVTTRGGACCFRSSICGSLSRRSGLAGKLPSAVIFGHARQWRPSPGRGHPRSTG